ncbi:hypothetical protein M9H77_28282 [Catharanthus roseus]|uniref:Uncharacterized protein n=1 Tax=Catharanthus roseus TaxID=4058 RepID=A0ACC0AH61_CATRO|nr:hypothetical protein M9H77_28282 [Catharanthus roseus]
METVTNFLCSSSITLPAYSLLNHNCSLNKNSSFSGFKSTFNRQLNGTLSHTFPLKVVSCAVEDIHKQRSTLESLFCYDKAIREEIIEKPVGLSLAEKDIGDHPRCPSCLAKGAVLCSTCAGSGLYVDSILESQGIIVKVRCLVVILVQCRLWRNWQYYVFRMWWPRSSGTRLMKKVCFQ